MNTNCVVFDESLSFADTYCDICRDPTELLSNRTNGVLSKLLQHRYRVSTNTTNTQGASKLPVQIQLRLKKIIFLSGLHFLSVMFCRHSSHGIEWIKTVKVNLITLDVPNIY